MCVCVCVGGGAFSHDIGIVMIICLGIGIMGAIYLSIGMSVCVCGRGGGGDFPRYRYCDDNLPRYRYYGGDLPQYRYECVCVCGGAISHDIGIVMIICLGIGFMGAIYLGIGIYVYLPQNVCSLGFSPSLCPTLVLRIGRYFNWEYFRSLPIWRSTG